MESSFLHYELEHSPITKDGIKLVSTPLSDLPNDILSDDLAPIQVDLLNNFTTPKRKTILKSSKQNLLHIPRGDANGLQPHSDSNSDFSSSQHARVNFSPTNQVVTYSDEVVEDVPKLPTATSGFTLMDPYVPYVISLYLQLFINVTIVTVVLVFGYIFYRTIRTDINHKLEIYTADALQEISRCSREYYRNKCVIENGSSRVPALERACSAWEKCMNRDPQLLGKSKITAETLADIVNGFIKPISWKALVFVSVFIFGSLVGTNVAFGSYRNSSQFDQYKETRELKKIIKARDEELSRYKQLELANETNVTFHTAHTPNLPVKYEMETKNSYKSGYDSTYTSPLLHRKGSNRT